MALQTASDVWLVSTTPFRNNFGVEIAGLATGGFVVGWTQQSNGGAFSQAITQRISGFGEGQGGNTALFSGTSSGNERLTDLVAFDNGDFAAAYLWSGSAVQNTYSTTSVGVTTAFRNSGTAITTQVLRDSSGATTEVELIETASGFQSFYQVSGGAQTLFTVSSTLTGAAAGPAANVTGLQTGETLVEAVRGDDPLDVVFLTRVQVPALPHAARIGLANGDGSFATTFRDDVLTQNPLPARPAGEIERLGNGTYVYFDGETNAISVVTGTGNDIATYDLFTVGAFSGSPTPTLFSATDLGGGRLLVAAVVNTGGNQQQVLARVYNFNNGAFLEQSATIFSGPSTTSNPIEDIESALLADGRVALTWTQRTTGGTANVLATIVDPRVAGVDLVASHNNTNQFLGTEFNDRFLTGNGDDSVVAGGGDDSLSLSTGNDLLEAGTGNDTLNAGSGNDIVIAGDGADSILGGSGNDLMFGYVEGIASSSAVDNDTFDGGGGNDTFIGGSNSFDLVSRQWTGSRSGFDVVSYASAATGLRVDLTVQTNNTGEALGDVFVGIGGLIGSAFDDHLRGTSGADGLTGGNGNDSLLGEAGNDVLDGGTGNDRLVGAAGIDSLDGGTGNDALYGGRDADVLLGRVGDDVLVGEQGADNLDGGDGNDSLAGGTENDSLFGWNGNDVLRGESGDDHLEGNEGNDNLRGDSGDDTLFGDAGVDRLNGGLGSDIVDGGEGNDLLYSIGNDDFGAGLDRDTFVGGGGVDLIDYRGYVGDGNLGAIGGIRVELDAGSMQVFLLPPAVLSGGFVDGDVLFQIENVIGTAFNDTLTGDDLSNDLNGWWGNDVVAGNGGADTLRGWDGNDTLAGDAGADVLIGGAGNDAADYAASATGVTVNLAAGTGTGGDAQGDTLSGIEIVFGSAGADSLRGGNFNETLSGADGTDRLSGGRGNDHLIGGEDNDVFVFADSLSQAGLDRIVDFQQWFDVIEVRVAIFGGGLTAGAAPQVRAGAGITSAGVTGGVFLHDTATGLLGFDADGQAAGSVIWFTEITMALGTALRASDFAVVA